MKKLISLLILFLMTGCASVGSKEIQAIPPKPLDILNNSLVVLPIDEYSNRLVLKAFGEYIQDRFTGYHVGDDIEYTDTEREIPVRAISNGEVVYIGDTSGYGGVIVIKHLINQKTIHAIYGHLDIDSTDLQKTDKVKKGQFIANLGEHKSNETDSERKHLHFGLYEGEEFRLLGYERTRNNVSSWINPYDFFSKQSINMEKESRIFVPKDEIAEDFKIEFIVPEGFEIEYIPFINALNIFTLSGTGSARERSQIFINYFNANKFLTLQTVNIHETNDLTVGTENYKAKRYDIEKKVEVPDFKDQPSWRNQRHLVTDFTNKEGLSRYYVIATNPGLNPEIYESFLETITITE